MSISISPEVQNLVQQEFATGHYGSPDEVLLTAVRLLRDRNRRALALRGEIRPALERLDRGEGERLDMEAIKAEACRQFEQSSAQVVLN